jgi:hypothetical protein
MALASTQPLTETSTRNLPGGKGRPVCKADNFTAVSRLSRKCGSLDVSLTYRPPRPVTETALLFMCRVSEVDGSRTITFYINVRVISGRTEHGHRNS